LRGAHDPFGEIAYIDELDRVIWCPRRQHLASASKPRRPVGEATCRVLWPDDQPRPANESAVADAPLARDLGGTIRLVAAALGLRCERRAQGGCVRPLRRRVVVGINTHRGDEGPMRRLLFERRNRAADLSGMA